MTTILVIEDEPTIRENIVETLELTNYKVLAAQNGLVGVYLARQHRPDLIICDIMMPELDGYGVLLDLHSDSLMSTVPFIFLTAKSDRAAIREGMGLGADDYLTKPFTPPELLDAVSVRLNKHSAIIQEHEQKLENLRGNLILLLPHELRTPLTAILGYSDLLLADDDLKDMPHVLSMVNSINRAGKRLYHLVENFLLYAQIEILKVDDERKANLQENYTAIPQAIIEEQAILKAREVNREADLRLDVIDVEAVRVAQDSLKKIVGELVDNAFKFSKAGTPVDVGTTVADAKYVLSIRDLGRGMTPQQIADIGAYMQFERTLHEQQGSGLGLSIARGLVELQGGQLTIESIPNQRTTVSVVFPLGKKMNAVQQTE